jgi:hypothetical protein
LIVEEIVVTEIAQLLTSIENTNDLDKLRSQIKNARGKSPDIEAAAFERLITVAAGRESNDPLARDLWKMVFAVEELRRMDGRKVWRMNRLRPTIADKGAEYALAYCAENRTDGFEEVLRYGRPDLLAENIAIRHADRLAPEVVAAARARLEEHGISPA